MALNDITIIKLLVLIIMIILGILLCIYYIIANNEVNGKNNTSNLFKSNKFNKPSCNCKRHVRFMV